MPSGETLEGIRNCYTLSVKKISFRRFAVAEKTDAQHSELTNITVDVSVLFQLSAGDDRLQTNLTHIAAMKPISSSYTELDEQFVKDNCTTKSTPSIKIIVANG